MGCHSDEMYYYLNDDYSTGGFSPPAVKFNSCRCELNKSVLNWSSQILFVVSDVKVSEFLPSNLQQRFTIRAFYYEIL